jgi:hypothetical protein
VRPQIAGPAKHRGFTPEGAGRAVAYGKLSLPASGPANSIVVVHLHVCVTDGLFTPGPER